MFICPDCDQKKEIFVTGRDGVKRCINCDEKTYPEPVPKATDEALHKMFKKLDDHEKRISDLEEQLE